MKRSSLAICVLILSAGRAYSGPVPLINDPLLNNAWQMSQVVGAGHGNNTQFEPFPADYASAIPLGLYSDANVAIGTVFGFFDEDTIRSIKTFVYAKSPTNLSVPIFVGGDDGHTVTLNGTTILAHPTGGPFSQITLDFHPGLNVLEAAVYNGPGLSLIQLTTNSTDTSLGQISSVPGLSMNANGYFASVPEPSSIVLGIVGACGLIVLRRWGSRAGKNV